MDKKSNRTDLLSAGRKKLQQYRQKKDIKGKGGKGKETKASRSTSKSDPAEDCVDDQEVIYADSKSKAIPSQLPIAVSELLHDSSASGLVSLDEYADIDVVAKVSDPLLGSASASSEEVVASASDAERFLHEVVPFHDVDVYIPKEENLANVNKPEDMGASNDNFPSVNAPGMASDVVVEEAQVSDVGSMQDVDRSGPDYFTQLNSMSTPSDGDQNFAISECNQTKSTPPESELSQRLYVCSPGGDDDYICARVTPLAMKMLPESPGELLAEENYAAARSSTEEETSELQDVSVHAEYQLKEVDNAPADGTTVDEGDGRRLLWGKTYEPDLVTMAVDPTTAPFLSGSMSLSHLATVLKGLSDDDFRFLVNSRELADSASGFVPKDVGVDTCQACQEQLYIANISKDFFHLEILEQTKEDFDHQHHQFLDEISSLSASLADFQEKNRSLEADLSQYKSQIQDAMHEKVIHLDQLRSLDAEVKEYTLRLNELKLKLKESASQASDLSTELTDCNSLLAASQAENVRHLGKIASLNEEINQIEACKDQYVEENKKLSTELVDCKNTLATMQIELSNLRSDFACLSDERRKLEKEKVSVVNMNEKLLADIDDYRFTLGTLEDENSKLNVTLAGAIKERKKVEEAKDHMVLEKDKISNELIACEDYVQDLASRFEQLAEGNENLVSNLQNVKAKTTQVDTRQSLSQAGKSSNQFGGSERMPAAVDFTEISSTQSLENVEYATDNPGALGFVPGHGHKHSSRRVAFKVSLAEVQKYLLDLEEAIQDMHSHSASLRHSGSKPVAISNLIQAFESKSHSDDHELNGAPLARVNISGDPYLQAMEQVKNLKALHKSMFQDIEPADAVPNRKLDDHESGNVTLAELAVQSEAASDCSINLELRNIELQVLYEALKQHICILESGKAELETSYDGFWEQQVILRDQNSELFRKLTYYGSRISDLQDQLYELQRSSEEVVSVMCTRVESLRGEMDQQSYNIRGEINSTLDKAVQIVEKLDATAGLPFSLTETGGNIDLTSRVSVSVDSACDAIEYLKKRLEISSREQDALISLNANLSDKLDVLGREHQLAVKLLHRVSCDLAELLGDTSPREEEMEVLLSRCRLVDPVGASPLDALLKRLRIFLSELKETNNDICSKLVNGTNEVEELRRKCIDLDALFRLVDNVIDELLLQDVESRLDQPPFLRLQSCVMLLVQKYKDADRDNMMLREDVNSRMLDFSELQEQIELLRCSNVQQQTENFVLKESLRQIKVGSDAEHAQLVEKINELEQSEQRVTSLREKLSIAVAKGKGLIMQRDNVKQSLAATSSELERCLQELQLEDARLDELDERLRLLSEAGERVQALESELSYIRNSATALRESFLLKDSSLQRIEEIMEDLELPEHFHSKDIIEKVNWLAKSFAANSMAPADCERRSSEGGESFSDPGFAVTDAWNEDGVPNSNSDDFRRKYDELQTKFYELAEQNEMLEQSLMERNNLVQRWEDMLARISIPLQLRCVEPEERITWLGSALSEADHLVGSLQQKLDTLESCRETLSIDREKAQSCVPELEASLSAAIQEKENISRNLSALALEHETTLEKMAHMEQDTNNLRCKVDSLLEQLAQMEALEHNQFDNGVLRLQKLVGHALQDPLMENLCSDHHGVENLEVLLRRLVEKYLELVTLHHGVEDSKQSAAFGESMVTETTHVHSSDHVDAGIDRLGSRDIMVDMEESSADLRLELDGAKVELVSLREERGGYIKKCESLASDIRALENKNGELLDLLNQEEQKSASLKDKLNIAVRKGKSLLQQRDGLKKNLEELYLQIERLNSELNLRQSTISDCEQKIRNLHVQVEKEQALESDNIFLKNQMLVVKQCLQDKEHILHMLSSRLSEVNIIHVADVSDPLQILDMLVKQCADLHAAVAHSERETNKSKRAAELLLAELDEVQEINDSLQEELSNARGEIKKLYWEKEVAESAKLGVLSEIKKLSEDKKVHLADFEAFKCGMHDLKKGFSDVENVIDDIFSTDVDLLQRLRACVDSCIEHIKSDLHSELKEKDFMASDSSWAKKQDQLNVKAGTSVCDYVGQHFEVLADKIFYLKRRTSEHSTLLGEECRQLIDLHNFLQRGILSQKKSLESLKGEVLLLQSIHQGKDMENTVLHRSIAMLSEACASSVMEIESRKAVLVGNDSVTRDLVATFKSLALVDGKISCSNQTLSAVDLHVKSLADGLSKAVKEIVDLQAEAAESHHKELRAAISDLQKELQEKQIQKEQISMDFVSQLKEAEAAATTSSRDLQSARNNLIELEKRLDATEKQCSLLEHRISELQQGQVHSMKIEDNMKSMTDMLAAKDQEIEALIQALEEEENQMEELRNRVDDLQKSIRQKDLELEQLEASRAKAIKKLSVTVRKFDQLHHISEDLLSEVEHIQSQLQERDSEISFLRQEVTRCTNDALLASEMRTESNSNEFHEFLTILEALICRAQLHDMHVGDDNEGSHHGLKERLQNDILSIVSELEDLRVVSQKRDALLQAERNKVEELLHREAELEVLIHEKESQTLEDVGVLGQSPSEIVEDDPVTNKRKVASTASNVRSLRKSNNNDQVSIAIDADAGSSGRLEDEEDDKIHGFRSLTTSRFIPKCTRPVSDIIDGLWVSCDRTLMRQPAFRLSIMVYWALLHALLAASVF